MSKVPCNAGSWCLIGGALLDPCNVPSVHAPQCNLVPVRTHYWLITCRWHRCSASLGLPIPNPKFSWTTVSGRPPILAQTYPCLQSALLYWKLPEILTQSHKFVCHRPVIKGRLSSGRACRGGWLQSTP